MAQGPVQREDLGCDRIPDAELMDRVRRGDASAFEILVRTHWDGLVGYAASLTADPDAAQDAVQETFARLWRARSQWRDRGSARAYLYRAVRNRIIDWARRRGVRERWNARWSQGLQGRPRTPAELLEHDELTAALGRAIRALPKRRREVFVLAQLQNLTYQEIAAVLDLAPQTVANHMSLALRDLRRALGPLFPSFGSLAGSPSTATEADEPGAAS